LLRLLAVVLRFLEASFSEVPSPLTVLFICVFSPFTLVFKLVGAPAAPAVGPTAGRPTPLGLTGAAVPLGGSGIVPGVMGMG